MNGGDGLIGVLCDRLRRHYVCADQAEAMCRALRQLGPLPAQGHELAAQLTACLQAVAPDRHLRVRWFAQAPDERGNDEDPAARRQRSIDAAIDHQGIHRVERLAGQVGLVEVLEFHPPVEAAAAIVAAMTLVAPSRALIFDLRRCRGGEPESVALWCSHLFGERPVHLNDLYLRSEDRVQSFWTRPEGPGPRLPDTPVFVLCSARTFSAGEEFAYDLQALRRATIVGETSRGGANPGRVHRLDEHFAAFIPDARAINPVTGDNWEGRGVRPDVACPADQALGRAHRLALEALLPGLERDPALVALRDEARQALASLPSPAS
jgi:hypothetical protein